MVHSLSRQALAVAFDTAPHRPPMGERRWAMAQALPAARVLVGLADDADRAAVAAESAALADTLAQPTGKVADGFGHSRPIYAWLGLHLLTRAALALEDETALSSLKRGAMLRVAVPDDDARLSAWRAVVCKSHAVDADEPALANEQVDGPAPLAVLGRDDLIDTWTYRELVGLHGLHLYAERYPSEHAAERVRSAAEYHLGHTQPDYTTYQPWGLAAFANDPQTAVFAEQQLHDVATHLSIEGPGGAVLPALLLADAWATMS